MSTGHKGTVGESLAERLEAAVFASCENGEELPAANHGATRNEGRSHDLIEATVWMVATHGISGATIARIADAAHVSRGLPRHYFATKAQLLTAAYERLAIQFVATLKLGALRGGPEPLAALEGAITAVFNPPHFNADRLRAWFGFWNASPRSRSFTEVDRWVSESHRAILESLLSRVAAERALEIDVAGIACGLSLLMDGAFVALAGTCGTLTPAMAEKVCSRHVQCALGVEFMTSDADEVAEAP